MAGCLEEDQGSAGRIISVMNPMHIKYNQIWNGSRSVDYPEYTCVCSVVGMVRMGDAALVSLPDCDFVTSTCSV